MLLYLRANIRNLTYIYIIYIYIYLVGKKFNHGNIPRTLGNMLEESQNSGEEEVILIIGSVFLMGPARKYLGLKVHEDSVRIGESEFPEYLQSLKQGEIKEITEDINYDL